MAEKKEKKWPYKQLKPDQVKELQSMSEEQLLKEYLVQSKSVVILKRSKADDPEITELKEEIKEHYESSETLKQKKEEIKELRKSLAEEIEDEIKDKKAKEHVYNIQIKEHQEFVIAIQCILDDRNPANHS